MSKCLEEAIKLIELEIDDLNIRSRSGVCAFPDAQLLRKLEVSLKKLRTSMQVNDLRTGMEVEGVQKKYQDSALHVRTVKRLYIGTQTKGPMKEL